MPNSFAMFTEVQVAPAWDDEITVDDSVANNAIVVPITDALGGLYEFEIEGAWTAGNAYFDLTDCRFYPGSTSTVADLRITNNTGVLSIKWSGYLTGESASGDGLRFKKSGGLAGSVVVRYRRTPA